MPTIKTIVDDETYARLTRQRRAAGLVSISALFLTNCGELSYKNEAPMIVRIAMSRALQREIGAEFTLSKLFQASEWKSFDKIARLRSGRMFKAEVDAAGLGIRAHRISSGNHQMYLRRLSALI